MYINGLAKSSNLTIEEFDELIKDHPINIIVEQLLTIEIPINQISGLALLLFYNRDEYRVMQFINEYDIQIPEPSHIAQLTPMSDLHDSHGPGYCTISGDDDSPVLICGDIYERNESNIYRIPIRQTVFSSYADGCLVYNANSNTLKLSN